MRYRQRPLSLHEMQVSPIAGTTRIVSFLTSDTVKRRVLMNFTRHFSEDELCLRSDHENKQDDRTLQSCYCSFDTGELARRIATLRRAFSTTREARARWIRRGAAVRQQKQLYLGRRMDFSGYSTRCKIGLARDEKRELEKLGIDPNTSRMLSERSTI
jgi:hypothetical protein